MAKLRLTLALVGLAGAAPIGADAQDGRAWMYNRYVDPSPLESVLNLGYGLPESDDVQASFLCSIGANWIYAQGLIGLDVQGLAEDATVALEMEAPGYSGRFDATVFRSEIGFDGVEFAVALDDALWTALMAGGTLSYGLSGRAREGLRLDGAVGPVHEFLGDCLSIGDLVPEAAPAATK